MGRRDSFGIALTRGAAGKEEDMNRYQPNPIDTSDVALPDYLAELTEKLAENVHETWARGRMEEGWVYGPVRDDVLRTTPCLVPYRELSEEERNYDRRTAMETIRQILKLGYTIEPKEVRSRASARTAAL